MRTRAVGRGQRMRPRKHAALVVVCAMGAAFASAQDAPGVVVERATPGFAGEAAGLAADDVILAWSRAANPPANPDAAHGELRTSFELQDVEIEQASRGSVTLLGRRGTSPMQWTLPPDEWRLVVRPHLPGEILVRAAEAQVEAKEWKRADELYAQALELLEDPMEAAYTCQAWAQSLASRGEADLAQERFDRARRLVESSRGESLALARALHGIASTTLKDYALAVARHQESLALRERLAPNSTAVADSLSALGMLALTRRDLAGAEEHLNRALRLREARPGLAYALDLSALGATVGLRSDHATAFEHLSRALPVLERLAPSSNKLAYALYMAGLTALMRGDLASAEGHARRALQVYRQLSRDDMRAGFALRMLSQVAVSRRDFDLAESHGREALAIMEAVAPGSHQVGEALHALGDIALDRGVLPVAEDYFRRALVIDEGQSPDSLISANDLRCLGLTLARSGRLDEGEQHAARSAEIRSRLVPKGLDFSRSLMALAEIASLQGRTTLAEERYREALAIRSRLLPGSREEAEVHHGLGRLQRQAGRLAEAAESFGHAIDALELQRTRLGGTDEARGSFSAAYSLYYQDAIETLVALGRTADAFHVLERSRARALLELLAERDLPLPEDVPPELVRERRANQSAFERAQSELAQLGSEQDGTEAERLLGRLRELREQGAAITARLRTASPRFASLQYPEPLGVAAAAAAFEHDTTYLAYAVGLEKTFLFALRSEEGRAATLQVFTLPIGDRALRERVETFRRLIADPDANDRVLRARAAELYDVLLGPADALLASGRRVALSADGALHLLPFAALIRSEAKGGRVVRRWLTEWWSLYDVGSATQYAELRKERGRPAAPSVALVAFGDPRTSSAIAGSRRESSPRVQASVGSRQAVHFESLRFARREVEAISALFGKGAVAYLGDQATEARAKAMPRRCSYVHFACHATLDPRLPLNSGLVLAAPATDTEGGDNGLLQVWEIFDSVRLDAELVTLSGCETALGQEMGGEGLMGLRRAFQYAGARSVVASLWQVSDRSTADLMVRFYGYLKSGQTKADALRAAQIDLIRAGGKTAPPFRWAAFVLFGDWR